VGGEGGEVDEEAEEWALSFVNRGLGCGFVRLLLVNVQACTNLSIHYDIYVSRIEADLAMGEFAIR
jgi:hypothetical protein